MAKAILTLTLNGRPREDAVSHNVLLIDYLREIAHLTGTKMGCDGGECGACTVLVDDRPRLSCITLAHSVAGKRVETIEGERATGACRNCNGRFTNGLAPNADTARRA